MVRRTNGDPFLFVEDEKCIRYYDLTLMELRLKEKMVKVK